MKSRPPVFVGIGTAASTSGDPGLSRKRSAPLPRLLNFGSTHHPVPRSCPVALRDGILYVHVLQPALHYELDRVNKAQILRKLNQRFGGRTICDLRFRLG